MRAFVAMPFHSDMNWVYDIIKTSCLRNSVRCVRVDDIGGVDNIWSAIKDEIEKSDFLICDFSCDPCFKGRQLSASMMRNSANSNVVTEAGYAMALEKPIILLTNNVNSLPFDWKTFLAIVYKPSEKEILQKTLDKQIIHRFDKVKFVYSCLRYS